MPRIVSFLISGYRAISEPVLLRDLGPFVPLYGDNAVGKSSLLRGLELFGRLCHAHPNELVGSGRPWPKSNFYERFGQNASMFNDRTNGEIRFEASTDSDLSVGFRLQQSNDGIAVTCTNARMGETSLLDPVTVAQEHVLRLTERLQREEDIDALEMERAQSERLKAEDSLHKAVSVLSVRLTSSPSLPMSAELRGRLFDSLASANATHRFRLRDMLRRLAGAFPSLGRGEIDLLVRESGEKDLAWVSADETHSIDDLGGGIQSALATIGNLYMISASIACLEEPEAFVGVAALDGVRAELMWSLNAGICEQIWIATHAIQLVSADDQIVVLTRDDGIVHARVGPAVRLAQRFGNLPSAPADPKGRLGHDGSIRLPPSIIETLKLTTGDFVYFSLNEDRVRLLSGPQLDATLPEE